MMPILTPFWVSLFLLCNYEKKKPTLLEVHPDDPYKVDSNWPWLKRETLIFTSFLLCNFDQQTLLPQKLTFLEAHSMNIPTKFDSNWSSGVREEYSKQTTPILTPLGFLFLLSNSD